MAVILSCRWESEDEDAVAEDDEKEAWGGVLRVTDRERYIWDRIIDRTREWLNNPTRDVFFFSLLLLTPGI